MISKIKQQWFEGERVIHLEPGKKTQVDDSWLHRPYLYTGRAFTDNTLISNTKHHIRHMKLFGRQMSAGVIRGLDLSYYTKTARDENNQETTEQWLRINEGLGLTVYGDDVSLAMTTDIFLENVHPAGHENVPGGAGIFVLEPIEIFEEAAIDKKSQCPWDRERDPLEDEQIIDSCRLVFYPWPEAELGPAPIETSQWFRNQLVYQIFDYELAHPGKLLPWDKTGVALGLTYISSEGVIQFIDEHAVVRQGGAPMAVQPMLMTNGTRFLWEARIQQLISHLYDIKEKSSKIPFAKQYFEVLPPVGILPRQILDFKDMSTVFFPSQFVVSAVPVPEEQLEVALNASAGLTPLDIHKSEKIKLLVPVPQAVYEPDLLKKEVLDPVFLETLRKLIQQIRKWVANRDFLRNQAAKVIGAIDFKDIPDFEEEDPDTIPDEKKFPVVIQPDEDLIRYDELAAKTIQSIYNWIVVNTEVTPSDFEILNSDKFGRDYFPGMESFIENLVKNIHKTEEFLSTNYIKTESEIYRLRQLILGNVKASRLATSPAMGKIVEGQTRTPNSQDVENYFTYAVKMENEPIQPDLDLIKARPPQGMDSGSDKAEGEKKTMAAGAIKITPPFEAAVNWNAQPLSYNKYYNTQPLSAGFIYKDSPLFLMGMGAMREKKIVERIYESPAMEIRSKAIGTKADIFESLQKIPLTIDDEVTVTTSGTAVLNGVEYQKFSKKVIDRAFTGALDGRARKIKSNSFTQDDFFAFVLVPLTKIEIDQLPEGTTQAQVNTFEQQLSKLVSKNKVPLRSETLSKNIRAGIFDPDPTDGDEATYFSVGVTALEHALEAMRVVDHKLDDYRKALKKCTTGLTDLGRNSKLWKDTLNEIDGRLSELRHDALVTRSLFAEERARIEAINQRRMSILTEYVTALAYVRPRLVEARKDMPSLPLYGQYISPVAAALAEDYEATGELEDMLDMFREVPVGWLIKTRKLLDHIDHLNYFTDMFRQADTRARNYIQKQPKAPDNTRKAYNEKDYGQSISKVIYAHQYAMKNIYAKKININTQLLAAMTWKDLKKKAETDLSLADMIEAGKGKSALASKATAIMEEIEDIAVSFYNRCNELDPAIRLGWANKISVFDTPINLQHLDVLPSWDKIEGFFRRDLQNMVDWLFSQVDLKISDAQNLMNDLVRVCILLASHAPVSTIIKGYAPEPAKGKIGDIVDLVVDKGTIKIGMMATVFMQGNVAVQGIVEDIAQGSARIKVTHTQAKTGEYAIDQGAQVKFHKRAGRKMSFQTG